MADENQDTEKNSGERSTVPLVRPLHVPERQNMCELKKTFHLPQQACIKCLQISRREFEKNFSGSTKYRKLWYRCLCNSVVLQDDEKLIIDFHCNVCELFFFTRDDLSINENEH